MGTREMVYKLLYRRAKVPSHVHWHHETNPRLLKDAIELLGGTGSALDIGCGTGVDSVFMAQQGLNVTGVDFVPQAIAFARERAERWGATVELIRNDITEFEREGTFDLLLDSGCLHGFDKEKRMRYKQKILAWMAPNAQYVLVHASGTKLLDFGLGPKSMSKKQIEGFFAPELTLADYRCEDPELSSGQHMCQYRFIRSDAVAEP